MLKRLKNKFKSEKLERLDRPYITGNSMYHPYADGIPVKWDEPHS